MFRQIAKHFGIGLATVLPFAFVIWVVLFVFDQVDGLFGGYVDRIGRVYVPGIGFLLVVIGITFVGAMTRLYLSRRLLMAFDKIFTTIPFVKSLYTAAKELVHNVTGTQRGFQRVVLVFWPDERAQILGFVTSEYLPFEVDPDGSKISVYLPNAFQFAGATVIVRKDAVLECALSVEEAFKFTLSAGLGKNIDSLGPIRANDPTHVEVNTHA